MDSDKQSDKTNETGSTSETPYYSVSTRPRDTRLTQGASMLAKKVSSFKSSGSPARFGARGKRWLTGLGVVIAVAVLSGMGGGWIEAHHNDGGIISGSLSDQKRVVTSEGELISNIAKTVGPSVVSVNVEGTATTTSVFGQPQSQPVAAAGTGIILTTSGLIMTNRHVVPIGTSSVSVTLSDGTELKDVSVIGRTNTSDSLDVAFLKINNTKGKKLTPAVLGDSTKVQVGDTVVAIGNALGQFQNTVTSGIISGYGRSVQASDSSGTNDTSENLDDLFQTDAAINEGNSGGPLVNLNGQVIGLNTAIAGNAQNIGFSIPINDISGLIKQVIQTGKLARPYLGVHYVPLTDDYAYQYNINVNRGAYIPPSDGTTPSVVSGSPADKAGLREKDVITQIDGTNIDEKHSLTSLLDQHQPGDVVNLTVLRDGKTIHVNVALGTAPSDS